MLQQLYNIEAWLGLLLRGLYFNDRPGFPSLGQDKISCPLGAEIEDSGILMSNDKGGEEYHNSTLGISTECQLRAQRYEWVE